MNFIVRFFNKLIDRIFIGIIHYNKCPSSSRTIYILDEYNVLRNYFHMVAHCHSQLKIKKILTLAADLNKIIAKIQIKIDSKRNHIHNISQVSIKTLKCKV